MIQASLTNPSYNSARVSHRVTTRRKLCSHAKSLSIFHLRLYLRSSLPSCVAGRTRERVWGAIIFVPLFKSWASSLSLSYALSPMRRRIGLQTNRLSRAFSTSRLSCGDALSICMEIGRPLPSAIAMILVPFPRLVGPTYRPLFLPPRRWHQSSIPINPNRLGLSNPWPRPRVSHSMSHSPPTWQTSDGKSGKVETLWEDPSNERLYEESKRCLRKPSGDPGSGGPFSFQVRLSLESAR